jgi:hypothetical protein
MGPAIGGFGGAFQGKWCDAAKRTGKAGAWGPNSFCFLGLARSHAIEGPELHAGIRIRAEC